MAGYTTYPLWTSLVADQFIGKNNGNPIYSIFWRVSGVVTCFWSVQFRSPKNVSRLLDH
jgi:hypothetical protein